MRLQAMPDDTTLDYTVSPGGVLTGRLAMPGDKSISHRALLLGALAEGDTQISGFLPGADCLATLNAIRQLGVEVSSPHPTRVVVHGRGIEGLRAPSAALDLGNSGTSMRLLTGLLGGQPFTSTVTGDASLRRRPMQRLIEPLSAMGVHLQSTGGLAPLMIHGRRPLKPLRYELPVASAQLKSALLLAGLYADGYTWLREPAPSRDHTERMLMAFGYTCQRQGEWLGIQGGDSLLGAHLEVPGDLSSAAFFLVGAAMTPGSHMLLKGIGVNPTRDGVIRILQGMGADIRLSNPRTCGTEPVADIEVQGAELYGTDIGPDEVVRAIDDIPALLIAAACARGTTTVRGAHELRVKESDRLAAMAEGLGVLGVPVELSPDGIRIAGVEVFQGGEVHSQGDHRIAMAFAMAALRAREPVHIRDCRNVDTSFPDFPQIAGTAGLKLVVLGAGA